MEKVITLYGYRQFINITGITQYILMIPMVETNMVSACFLLRRNIKLIFLSFKRNILLAKVIFSNIITTNTIIPLYTLSSFTCHHRHNHQQNSNAHASMQQSRQQCFRSGFVFYRSRSGSRVFSQSGSGSGSR